MLAKLLKRDLMHAIAAFSLSLQQNRVKTKSVQIYKNMDAFNTQMKPELRYSFRLG